MHKDFENGEDFEAYRKEIDERMDFDKSKEERLLSEMHQLAQDKGSTEIYTVRPFPAAPDDVTNLANQPYLTAPVITNEKKRRDTLPPLKTLASMAAIVVLAVALFLYVQPFLRPSHLLNTNNFGAGNTSQTDSLLETSETSETSGLTEQTDTATTSQTLAQETVKSGFASSRISTFESAGVSAGESTSVSDHVIYYSNGKSSPPITTIPWNGITTTTCTWGQNSNSSGIGCNGILWMSIDQMRSELDIFQLNRFYDDIPNGECSVPTYTLSSNEFFDIIKTIKKYNWIDHRDYVNAFDLKACTVTVIGNNTVYTYLVFGKDESGKYFVWSFYDYKIAYLSEQDYDFIENIFKNAG